MPIYHKHYVIYKPFGILSQMGSNDARQNRKKQFLTELGTFPKNVMPIGRLDEKSEGLLLLTTDGKLSDTINRGGIEKEYHAQLDGVIDPISLARLQDGVTIGLFGKKYRTKPCFVEFAKNIPSLPEADRRIRMNTTRGTSWIRMVLKEGKFRQVRKMTAAVGFPTLRLIRTRIGPIHLDGLHEGEIRVLHNEKLDTIF